MVTLTYRDVRLLALVIGLVIATGFAALLTIGRQEDPTITNLFATIVTPFPGADPERVEALVTEKIEAELREIEAIDTISSTSRQGLSVISVELSSFLADAALPDAWAEIRNALRDAARELPPGVPEPEFDDDRTGAYTAILAVRGVAGVDVAPALLRRLALELQDRLRQVPETKLVDTYGAVDEEILVAVDQHRLADLALDLDAVAAAIRAADAKVAAGAVRSESSDLLIEVAGEIDGLERIRSIPLRTATSGITVRVGDVAQVQRAARTPPSSLAFADGRPAVLVGAKMADDRQVDAWSARFRAAVAEVEASLPAGVEIATLFDQSRYTADRFRTLLTNMGLGVGLVIAVLVVTLGWRSALVVALILPLTALLSVAVLQRVGVPLHQMSVTGLIVALGLLVDAAIVMTDEIRRRIAAGLDRTLAVGRSVERLAVPLLASTLTTILAFMPMAVLPGPAGDFVGSIATAVIVMLTMSLLLALLVTPALAGHLMPAAAARRGWWEAGIDPGRVGVAFARSIRLALDHPRLAMVVACVLPVIGFGAFPTLTAQFFPGVDRDQFYVQVRLDGTASLAASVDVASRAEALLLQQPEVSRVHWVVGESAPAFYYNMQADQDGVARFAEALVTTSSPAATAVVVPRLQHRFDEAFPGAQIIVRDLVQGPPVSAPVEFRVYGPDLAVLRTLGEELRSIMSDVPTVTHTRASITGGVPKLVLDVDETAARTAGLRLTDVARQLDAALEGTTGGSLIEGSEELPVRVRLHAESRDEVRGLQDLVLIPPVADATTRFPGMPVDGVARLEVQPSEVAITRRNGERLTTVQGYVAYGVLPEEALDEVRAALAERDFALPEGYRLGIGGDSDARDETVGNLASSVGLIVALTVATIVLTFRSYRLSLIAGAVSVLSMGLSLLALAVFGYPFGIQALIGVIGSIGVSINAAIIVLTALRDTPKARNGDRDAMAAVVVRSSRHILSTTVTTFGGFLPLILAGGGFWPPFAMAIAGGVLLSVVVAFYFTPPAFALVAGRASSIEAVNAQPLLAEAGRGRPIDVRCERRD
ncbi:MAG: efflux RND transporter permease subunit [Pseudomonadota bacterium]